MSDLLAYCQDRTDEMVDLLRACAEYETFTADKPAVDQFVSFLAGQLRDRGAVVERIPRREVGDLLLAKWNAGAPGRPITYVGHMDTVWPAGTLAERPLRVEGGRLYGPGVADMKGGIVVMLSAIRALQERGEMPDRPIWALLTSDEETGSAHSRELILKVARQSGLCVIIEPATAEGAVKTWRKGAADCRLLVTGRASHAGAAPEAGINAVVELAHQILKLNALNDLRNGTSVTVTMARGGYTNNVVPESAEAYIDMRFLKRAEAERVQEAVTALYPLLPGAQLEIIFGDNRPPLERDERMRATYAQLVRIADGIGVTLREDGTGGVSDGNLTASVGTPTLDGMGPTGEGLHAVDENVLISSLPERMAVHVALIQQWVMES